MAKLVNTDSVVRFVRERSLSGAQVSVYDILVFLNQKEEDVVRCKNCQFFDKSTISCIRKKEHHFRVYPNHYCGDGIKREESEVYR